MTGPIAQQADAIVAAVFGAYERTEDALDGVFGIGADERELIELRKLKPQIDTWATTLRGAAERGRREDGGAYDWLRWSGHGRTLAGSVEYFAGIAADDDLFEGMKYVVGETASTIGDGAVAAADAVNVSKWAGSTKLLAGLALAAVLVVKLR